MKQIPPGTALHGNIVTLLPIDKQHFDELAGVAAEPAIWTHIPRDMGRRERACLAFAQAIEEREKGTQYPFVIYHNNDKKLIGSTRLMDIQPAHNKLEIGWTWLHPHYWGTTVNPECKLLLLTYCFETLGVYRVQLKTDEHNIRSRTAIAKIGAKYEGILRNDMVRENGTKRNTAYYSITDDEWPEVKKGLTGLYERKSVEEDVLK